MVNLDNLVDYCNTLAVSFSLTYSEAENLWYADARGCGKGEYWEVKRMHSAQAAVDALTERLKMPR